MTYQPFPASMFMGTLGGIEPPVSDGYPDYWHIRNADTVSNSTDIFTPTTAVDLTILAGHIKPDTNYLLIWSAEAAAATFHANMFGGLFQDDVLLSSCNPVTYDTTPQDWHPIGGFRVYEAPSVIADDITFAVKAWKGDVAPANMRNAKLTVLKLADDEPFAQNNAPHTSTSFPTTALSLTATEGGTNSNHLWLISFTNETDNSVVGSFFQIMDGASQLMGGGSYGSFSEHRLTGLAIRYDSMAVPKTLTLQHGPGTAGIGSVMDDMCLVCLNLNRFIYDQTTDIETDNTGTDTAWTAIRSLEIHTPEECDHLFIGVISWEGSNTGLSNYYKIDDGEYPSITEAVRRPRLSNNGSDWESGISQNVDVYGTDTHTQVIYRKSETSSTTTRIKYSSSIHTVSLFGYVRGDEDGH